MDFSGLYELIERFHRTNQLPAFLIGVVVALLLGYFVLRLMRLRLGGSSALNDKVDRLEKQIEVLHSEKDRLRNELHHAEKDADAARTRIGELTGRRDAQTETITALTVECERLKEEMSVMEQEGEQLRDSRQQARRRVAKLRAKLETIAVSDGRIWEVASQANVFPFRSLSQRHTPILSLLNLKGGVGKTTIAANLALAMSQRGWRVLLVDLDHQGSLSQLLLSGPELEDLLGSRRLVHDALNDPDGGLAKFRQAMVRVTSPPQAEVFLVAADEELINVETSLSQRWLVKMTPDDVRYRLRAILHADEVSRRFDFILLDCPPRLTTACINALGASDYVLIPVLPNSTSTVAVPRLLRWLKHLCKVACPELAVMGVVGNKAKFFRDAPVKKQQAELNSLAGFCQDTWGKPIKFFSALRMHDPLVQPLPALDPKLRGAYIDLVHQLNEELPRYARSRSSELSASLDPALGSLRG